MNDLFNTIFNNKIKLFLALTLPAIIIYFKTVYFEFSPLDEQWMIVKNATFFESWKSMKEAFFQPLANVYYRPLFVCSLIIDYHIAKLSPGFYHFINLIWHLTSVILVYNFLILFQKDQRKAFILALIFSIHPIVLHAVAWIPGRNDIMLCCFSIASIIYLKKYIDTSKILYIFIYSLFFICALLTKETAIILPVIYLLVCLSADNFIKRKAIITALSCFTIAVCWLFVQHAIAGHYIEIGVNFMHKLFDFFKALIVYTGKAILPIEQSVYPTLKNSNLIIHLIVIALLLLMVIKAGIENKKTAYLGLSVFLLLLIIPTWFGASKSSGEYYEHRLYACLPGLLLFFSQLKFPQRSIIFNYFLACLIFFFAIKTYLRLNVYKDRFSFAEAGIKESPDYYLFYQTKGELMFNQKNFTEALTCITKAIELRPDRADMYANRGIINFKMGNYNEAIEDYTKAINNYGYRKEFVLNRCISYIKTNRIGEATADYLILKKYCPEIIPVELEYELNQKSKF